jgi:hypothetical protein
MRLLHRARHSVRELRVPEAADYCLVVMAILLFQLLKQLPALAIVAFKLHESKVLAFECWVVHTFILGRH